jgi:hypothetical protein
VAGAGAGVPGYVLQLDRAQEPVLAGDGQLGLVKRGELPGGEATFRLELQVPETRPVGERTRLIEPGPLRRGKRPQGGGERPQGARFVRRTIDRQRRVGCQEASKVVCGAP